MSDKGFNGFLSTYEDHTSEKAKATEFVLSRSLKQHYPDHYVTQVDSDCDLQGFASAGLANMVLDDEADSYTASVGYATNPFRLNRDREPGQVRSNEWFAKYKYTWDGTEFLYYVIRLKGQRGVEVYQFLLSSRAQGLTAQRLTAETEALLRAVGMWSNTLHDELYVFDMGMWQKNKELWKSTEAATWDDVVLDPATKQGLIEDIEGFFDSRELYAELQVPWKRGIILHGLPGNGKTASIKAVISRLRKRGQGTDVDENSIAQDSPIPSLYVKSFEDQCQGPQYAIYRIFSRARRMAPCLLVFEDLDSLLTKRTRSYFLNEVDGLEANDGILMVGSTNHLDNLDPAIRDRPSRFDRKYYYPLPGPAERASYTRYWKAKLEKRAGTGSRVAAIDFPDAACDFIASITDGFSFAYLKELFIAALLNIARGGKGEGDLPVIPSETATPESGVVVQRLADQKEEGAPAEGKAEAKGKKDPTNKKSAEITKKLKAARLRLEALAAVEIPEDLRDNVLVKVIRQEIYVLLKEMDSNETGTAEEGAETTRESGTDSAASDDD